MSLRKNTPEKPRLCVNIHAKKYSVNSTHIVLPSPWLERESGYIFSSAKIKRNLNSFLSFLILLIILSSSHFVHRQCSMGKTWKKKRKEMIELALRRLLGFQHWNNLRISHWILLAGPVRSTQRRWGMCCWHVKRGEFTVNFLTSRFEQNILQEMCHYIVVGKFHQHEKKSDDSMAVSHHFPANVSSTCYPTTSSGSLLKCAFQTRSTEQTPEI